MTVKKTLKRRVRARMIKTGERYAAARRQVIGNADAVETATAQAMGEVSADATVTVASVEGLREPEGTVPAGNSQALGMSDAAMRRRTGRGWTDWLSLIDAWGGTRRTHPEIASWLSEVHGVDGWSAQSVTVGYERARGMRAMGQLVDGFSATASKTVGVKLDTLYEAVADGRRRARWLPGAPLTVRTATPNKSVRGAWNDELVAAPAKGTVKGSRVEIGFIAKGEGKSQIGVGHSRLKDAAAADAMKGYWRERLATLKQMLEE